MKNWFKNLGNKIRNGLYKFMYGRNGVDQFSNFLIKISFIFIIIPIFVRGYVGLIFNLLFWIIIIYAYFRILSKNIYKRQSENTWFINKINYLKTRFTQRKQYKFYNCPKCKTHLRIPRGVGKVTITCKKCGYEFDRKA